MTYKTAKAATFNTLKETKGNISQEDFSSLYHIIRSGIVSVASFSQVDDLESDETLYSDYCKYVESFNADTYG